MYVGVGFLPHSNPTAHFLCVTGRLGNPAKVQPSWPRSSAQHKIFFANVRCPSCPCRLGTATLQFPCHLYFLSPGKLSKYSLASKKSGCFVSLPPVDSSGAAHEAKQLVHSPKQHAWLVFFEARASAVAPAAAGGSTAASPTEGGASGGSSGSCHFTLVQDAAAAGQATWFLPGACVDRRYSTGHTHWCSVRGLRRCGCCAGLTVHRRSRTVAVKAGGRLWQGPLVLTWLHWP